MTTLTVAIDKSISIDDRTFAVAGEMGVALTVNVDASLQSLGNGKLTYLDFLQPDGTAYYKGEYDCSSGTFGVTLGATDTVLSYAGDLWIQLVIRDEVPPDGVVVWKSNMLKVVVGNSVGATVPATIAIVPPLTMPETYPAETVTIADAGDLITATNTEDALQELATNINTIETNVGTLLYTENNYITDSEPLTASVDKLDISMKDNADAIALKMNLAGGSDNPFTAMPYVGTAPIVESGSNANGSYVKFADGTMICRHSVAISAYEVLASPIYYGGAGNLTFPSAFYAAPNVTLGFATSGHIFGGRFASVSTTAINDIVFYTSADNTTGTLYYTAIGRWKE